MFKAYNLILTFLILAPSLASANLNYDSDKIVSAPLVGSWNLTQSEFAVNQTACPKVIQIELSDAQESAIVTLDNQVDAIKLDDDSLNRMLTKNTYYRTSADTGTATYGSLNGDYAGITMYSWRFPNFWGRLNDEDDVGFGPQMSFSAVTLPGKEVFLDYDFFQQDWNGNLIAGTSMNCIYAKGN